MCNTITDYGSTDLLSFKYNHDVRSVRLITSRVMTFSGRAVWKANGEPLESKSTQVRD